MNSLILRADAAGVVTVTLNRPEKMNALTNVMYRELADILSDAENSADVRVVVLRAAGPNFCAGNDLANLAAIAEGGVTSRQVIRFLEILATAKKPLIAAVQGRAVGIGTTMLLHCDLVVVAESARLSVPFVPLGLVPEAASSLLLPGRIGHARAFEMFALGKSIDAQEAVALGLANRCVLPEEVDREAHELASRLAELPCSALAATKALMRDGCALSEQMKREDERFSAALHTAEVQSALERFANRHVEAALDRRGRSG